jgi:hypothetical protein
MALNAYRPSESLFPTETVRPTASLGDGGIIIDYTPGPDDNRLAEDHLSVDPNNPNADVDGRDFLVWQRGNATPASGPAGETDGLTAGQLATLLLPAVQDHGLLLPAVTIAHEGFLLI